MDSTTLAAGDKDTGSVINKDTRVNPRVIYYKLRDQTVPLWSLSSSDPGKEYHQFEIFADHEDDDDDAQHDNDFNVKCHVCDMDVPSGYWSCHVRSSVHQACCAIAEGGLDRAKRQMSLNAQEFRKTKKYSITTYFCASCSQSISYTKIRIHQNSEEHTNSVMYEKLMQSFASLYQDKNNLTRVCKEIFAEITMKMDGIGKNVKVNDNKRAENITDGSNETKDRNSVSDMIEKEPTSKKNNMHLKSEIVVSTNPDDIHVHNNEAGQRNFQSNALSRIITKETDSNNQNVKQLNTPRKNILEKPMANRNDANMINTATPPNSNEVKNGYCNVCNVNVPNTNHGIEEHVKGKVHKENADFLKFRTIISQRLGNTQKAGTSNVSQTVDNTETNKVNIDLTGTSANSTKSLYECSICKVKVTDSPFCIIDHCQSAEHIKKFEKLPRETQLSFYETEIFAAFTKNQPNVHGDKQPTTSSQTSKSLTNKNSNSYKDNNTSPLNADRWYECHICNVKMPNISYQVKQHIKSPKHKKFLELLKPNSAGTSPIPIERPKDKYFCQTCETEVPNKNIETHVKGKRHQENLKLNKSHDLLENNTSKSATTNVETGEIQAGTNILYNTSKVNKKSEDYIKENKERAIANTSFNTNNNNYTIDVNNMKIDKAEASTSVGNATNGNTRPSFVRNIPVYIQQPDGSIIELYRKVYAMSDSANTNETPQAIQRARSIPIYVEGREVRKLHVDNDELHHKVNANCDSVITNDTPQAIQRVRNIPIFVEGRYKPLHDDDDELHHKVNANCDSVITNDTTQAIQRARNIPIYVEGRDRPLHDDNDELHHKVNANCDSVITNYTTQAIQRARNIPIYLEGRDRPLHDDNDELHHKVNANCDSVITNEKPQDIQRARNIPIYVKGRDRPLHDDNDELHHKVNANCDSVITNETPQDIQRARNIPIYVKGRDRPLQDDDDELHHKVNANCDSVTTNDTTQAIQRARNIPIYVEGRDRPLHDDDDELHHKVNANYDSMITNDTTQAIQRARNIPIYVEGRDRPLHDDDDDNNSDDEFRHKVDATNDRANSNKTTEVIDRVRTFQFT